MSIIPRSQVFDFDSLFSDWFHGFGRPQLKSESTENQVGMRVDVHENDDSFEIHADLPGVKKDDIHIELMNDILTISASKITESSKKEKGKVVWRERSSGSISRSFSVNPGTTEKDVSATFKDGVLQLTVPKVKALEKERPSKRIPIK